MGVDYSPYLGVGVEVETLGYAEELLEQNGISLPDNEEDVAAFILEELDSISPGLSCTCLDCYSGYGYGYVIGYELSPLATSVTLEDQLKDAKQKWNLVFTKTKSEVIYTTRVW